jgi:hypothetical protein
MARSKSIPGSKINRASENKEQSGDPITLPEARAVAETTPLTSPEVKIAGETAVTPAAKVPEAKAPESRSMSAAKAAPEVRKFEVTKTESRKNVVPINLDDEIRRRAYELYEKRGTGSGSEADDWLAAEREVRQRYRQQSA